MTQDSVIETKQRYWNKDSVIVEIQSWHQQQKPLYSHYMRQHFQELLAAGIRYYGSWKIAVQAAGIAYDSIRKYKKWTKDNIIAAIQQLQQQGIDLSFRSMMLSEHAPMVYAAIRAKHFGSWRNALTAAGLPSEDIYRYRSWDDETIISEIRRLKSEGADLSSKKMDENSNPLIATARRRFGSWGAAVEKAGFDYTDIRRRRRWTRDEVIEEVTKLVAEKGPMRGIDVRRINPSLFAAACKPRFFGSWKKAVQSVTTTKTTARDSSLLEASSSEALQS